TPALTPPSAANLRGLHVAARLVADPQGASEGEQAFIDRYGRRISARAPSVSALFAALAAAYPATLPVDAVLNQAGAERARVANALLTRVCSGRALVSAAPIEVGRESDTRPKVWAHARAEAAMNLPGVTNLHHITVALPKISTMIAAMADGTRDREELA